MSFGESLLSFQGKIPRPKIILGGSSSGSGIGNLHKDHHSRTTPPPDYLCSVGGACGGSDVSSSSSVSSFSGSDSVSSGTSEVFKIAMNEAITNSDLANITKRLDRL